MQNKKGNAIRIGFVVNPLAGVGGPAANKGSDDTHIQQQALAGQIALRAPERARQFIAALSDLIPAGERPAFCAAPGSMGENYFQGYTFDVDLTGVAVGDTTSCEDTKNQIKALLKNKVDLCIFVGGDGTARDVCSVLGHKIPVLGIPSGVKMHSGVFAVAPQPAANIVHDLVCGELTALVEAEVRDIDEQAFREGRVKSRYYGDMLVPAQNEFIQAVKQGGMEVEEFVLLNIADEIKEQLDLLEAPTLIIFGPGSTTQFVEQQLKLPSTLLGVDAFIFEHGEMVEQGGLDVDANTLSTLTQRRLLDIRLVITAIGGQGHIIGRGNQQLTPSVLKKVTKANTWVIATKTKLESLHRRPLLVDTSDPILDEDWSGFISVICGYRDVVLYPLGWKMNTGTDELQQAKVDLVVGECKSKMGERLFNSRRLFHGRGGKFQGLEWCCVDLFSTTLLITLFENPGEVFVNRLVEALIAFDGPNKLTCVFVQFRGKAGGETVVAYGESEQQWRAHREGICFELSTTQQNVGFFLDIEPARFWLEKIAQDKKVLNLFSYTCAFSAVALAAGAQNVVNIDMSKKALATGRNNHSINKLPSDKVKYLAHNIFKSWGKLKREGPYDIVIIDPPSYQKGSFVARKDYQKVLRKMPDLIEDGGCFLACCNAPEVTSSELKRWVQESAPMFQFEQRLKQSEDFPDVDEEKALKMLVYRKQL